MSAWETAGTMLDIRPEWLKIVRELLAVHVPDAEVWAYGSRVQGTAHDGSDLDLVIRNTLEIGKPQADLNSLREALRESGLPILVDVLDWARIPESFQREIARGGKVVLQMPPVTASQRP